MGSSPDQNFLTFVVIPYVCKAMEKSLPEDLIPEILSRLPAKSLLRFRCVCRSWYNLITSPNFINLNLSKSHDSLIVIRSLEDKSANLLSFHSYESLNTISSFNLEVPNVNTGLLDVVGTCNGIFCLFDFKIIILCNPAMRELKLIYEGLRGSCPNGHHSFVTSIGLGFDRKTNDYKVIRFDYYYEDAMDDDGETLCQIYNLSTDSWRPIEHDIDIPNRVKCGALLKGRCHWIARREQNHRIISFDFSTEEFQEMDFPHIDHNARRYKHLAVLDESLVLLAYTDPQRLPPEDKFVDIWVMQQYGVAKSWTKKFTVGPLMQLWSPIMLWKKETILLVSEDGRLVSCAIGNVMNDFGIHGKYYTMKALVYQESLVSIW